jgi:riboflavin synthase
VFTGIIEEVGRVADIQRQHSGGALLRIQCRTVLQDATVGSSIAVNGVCLTALDLQTDSFAADLAPETLLRSNLGDVRPGSRVNLERPLAANGRLSGHIVQGHVDGTGEVISFDPLGDGNWWLKVRVPAELDRFLVYKGSIAIDGVSLTIATLEDGVAGVTIIPHTVEATRLGDYHPGTRVNIECDILAKHVEKLMAIRTASLS